MVSCVMTHGNVQYGFAELVASKTVQPPLSKKLNYWWEHSTECRFNGSGAAEDVNTCHLTSKTGANQKALCSRQLQDTHRAKRCCGTLQPYYCGTREGTAERIRVGCAHVG